MHAKTEVIQIFTDGGCHGNPGPGAWAALLRFRNTEKEIAGFEPLTTNNRMELMAAIQGLQAVKTNQHPIILYTDSQYLKRGIHEWMEGWIRNGWRTADKKSVKNKDLWEALRQLTESFTVKFEWVKGHAGHQENERVDQLVQRTILNNKD